MSTESPSAIHVSQLGEPVDLRPIFGTERAALLALLRGLSSTDWVAPTVCPGWSVADLAAHLLGDDLGRLARGRDGHVGLGTGPDESFPRFLDRINEEWVVACRRLSPLQVVDGLERSGAELARWWMSLPADAASDGVSWAGVDPAPVWFDAARDHTEYWLHEQQLREAVSAPLRNDAPSLRRTLDVLVRGVPFALATVAADDEAAGILRTSGGLSHRWTFRRGSGRWWLVEDRHDDGEPSPWPVAWEVLVDADDLWRRWIRHPAAAEIHVRTAGDPAATTAVLDHVAVIRESPATEAPP
jgi:uncharacterized protein (TIGR03083 family)